MNQVEIANYAITRLGGRQISTLDQDSESAQTMNSLFEDSIREVLEVYPWPDVIKRTTLAAVTDGESYTRWEHCYQLPNDIVWLIDILDPDSYEPLRNVPSLYAPSPTRKPIWEREQHRIFCDVSPCRIMYVFYPTDFDVLSVNLAKAAGLKLAHNAAQRLGKSEETQSMLFSEYSTQLTLAMSLSGNDGRGEPHEMTSWGDSR